MFSEDFAYYTAGRPALYFSLGIAQDGFGMAGVHTPEFTAHRSSLAAGIELMTLLAQLATTSDGSMP
jgi:metal-dependent amidase/aminoacylase/carboxypeptidase family protein